MKRTKRLTQSITPIRRLKNDLLKVNFGSIKIRLVLAMFLVTLYFVPELLLLLGVLYFTRASSRWSVIRQIKRYTYPNEDAAISYRKNENFIRNNQLDQIKDLKFLKNFLIDQRLILYRLTSLIPLLLIGLMALIYFWRIEYLFGVSILALLIGPNKKDWVRVVSVGLDWSKTPPVRKAFYFWENFENTYFS